MAAYVQVRVLDVERRAHVREVVQALLVQQDVDGDPALVGRLHEIAQQVHVREDVHHQRDDLWRRGDVRHVRGRGFWSEPV